MTRRGYNGALHESEKETNKRSDTRGRCSVDDLPDLATPKQVREVLPFSDYQLKALIRERQIGHVRVGSRVMIPRESVRQFIADNTVQPCRVETPAHVSASLKSAAPTTSSGPKPAAAGSAARALQIAAKLKSRSPSSSDNEAARAGPRDPSEILVTDVLADYAEEHGQRNRGTMADRLCRRGARRILGRTYGGTVTRRPVARMSGPVAAPPEP